MPDAAMFLPSQPPNGERGLIAELRRTMGRLDLALGLIREALVLVDAGGHVELFGHHIVRHGWVGVGG